MQFLNLFNCLTFKPTKRKKLSFRNGDIVQMSEFLKCSQSTFPAPRILCLGRIPMVGQRADQLTFSKKARCPLLGHNLGLLVLARE